MGSNPTAGATSPLVTPPPPRGVRLGTTRRRPTPTEDRRSAHCAIQKAYCSNNSNNITARIGIEKKVNRGYFIWDGLNSQYFIMHRVVNKWNVFCVVAGKLGALNIQTPEAPGSVESRHGKWPPVLLMGIIFSLQLLNSRAPINIGGQKTAADRLAPK